MWANMEESKTIYDVKYLMDIEDALERELVDYFNMHFSDYYLSTIRPIYKHDRFGKIALKRMNGIIFILHPENKKDEVCKYLYENYQLIENEFLIHNANTFKVGEKQICTAFYLGNSKIEYNDILGLLKIKGYI